MNTGQYRTKRLIVTKSYIAHRSRRFAMSEVIAATQPKNNPAALLASLVLAGCAVVFSRSGELLFYALGFCGLMFLGALLPPPQVNLMLANGETYRISLNRERRPQHAIRTIQANIQEYHSKASRAKVYTLPTSSLNATLNPEEYVRRYVLQLLTLKFGYSQSDIGYEFPIKLGSSQKRADVVVFYPGKPHTQPNIYIIVECKRDDRRNDYAAQEQLESYLAACINARYGVVATHRWRVTEKINTGSMYEYRSINALVGANGIPMPIDYRPGHPVIQDVSEDEIDELLNDDLINEPESRIPDFLRGNLRYALAVGVVCAGLFWVANAVQPVSVAVPTVGAPQFPTRTSLNQQAVINTDIPPSPGEAMTALPFVTFTPSPRFDQRAAMDTTIAPIQVEALTTSTATLTPMPLPVKPVSTVLISTPAPTNTPTTSRSGVINTNVNINVRRTPSTNANVIAVLQPGAHVQIIGENADGSWLNVRLSDGKEGWVASRLVRIE